MSITTVAVAGQRTTTDGNTDRQQRDVSKMISYLEPNVAPLLTLTTRLKKQRVATNKKYEWTEETPYAPFLYANAVASQTGGTKTIVIPVNYDILAAGMTLFVPRTGETMRVQVTPTTSSVVCYRGLGSSAAALVADEPIMVMGGASVEGVVSPDVVTKEKTLAYNYVQDIRRPVEMSDLAMATMMYGTNSEFADLMREEMSEFKKQVERSMWWGNRASITETVSSKGVTFMGGIVTQFMDSSLITDFGGVMTETDLEEALEESFRYGSDTKYLFASQRLCAVIDGFGRDKLRIYQDKNAKNITYGMRISHYISTFGDLIIVPSKTLWRGDVYGQAGAIIDLNNIKKVTMQGLGEKVRTNIKTDDGYTARKDEIRGVLGIQVEQPLTHSLLKNVSS